MPYEEHEAFTNLPDHTVVWRYMDLSKFQKIIESKALWFARTDKFDDKLEGTLTNTDQCKEKARRLLEEKFAKPWALTDNTIISKLPLHMGVNCWHINDTENPRMWEEYVKDKEGIAIQSTFGNLKASIIDNDTVYFGKVKYIDYDLGQIDESNYLNYFLHKKKIDFEWESELRGIIFKEPPYKTEGLYTKPDYTQVPFEYGKCIEVDFKKLIQNIYVKPGSTPEFYRHLDEILQTHGFKDQFTIIPSKLQFGSFLNQE